MEIFKLFGSILVDNDEANKSISKTDEKAEGLGKKLGNGIKTAGKWGAALVAGASAAAGGMFLLAKPLVEAAAEADALGAQFEQVFGDLETKAQDTLNNLGKEFGMLPNRLKPSFTKTTSMFKGFGMSTEESMGAAGRAVTLAADAAAFYDVSLDSADDALTSFLKGNTNAAESIGIFATAAGMADFASKELGLEWKKLDEGGKQLVRLKYVEKMQEAAGATGQAARESDGLENVMGNLRQAWDDLKVKFGVPILEPAVKGIQRLTEFLTKVDTDKIIAAFESFISFIQTNVIPPLESTGQFISNFVITLREWFVNLRDSAVSVLGNFAPLFETLKGSFQSLLASLGPIWESMKTLFVSLLPILKLIGAFVGGVLVVSFGMAISTFSAVISAIGPLINAFLNFVDVIVNVVNTVIALLTGDFSGAMKYWEKATNSTVQFFINLWKAVSSFFSGFIKTMIGYVKGLVTTMGGDFKSFQTMVTGIFNSVKTFVITAIVGMVNGAVGKFRDMKSNATTLFNGIKNAITNPIETAKDIIGRTIEKIKGFFTGLKLKFPKIDMPKLPHFKLDGKFSLMPPSVPKLKVDWFKDGGIFAPNSPRLIGIGDAQVPEAALPLSDSVLGKIGQMIAQTMPGGGSDELVNLLIEQNRILSKLLNKNQDVYISGEKVTDVVNSNNAIASATNYF